VKLVTFKSGQGKPQVGVLTGQTITPVGDDMPSVIGQGVAAIENARKKAGAEVELSEAQLLAPIPSPGKIMGIGLNYRDHAAESGMPVPKTPVVFVKYSTAVVGPDVPIRLPAFSDQVDYEAELGVVIGDRARDVPASQALDHVFGYLNINDVSARDLQFGEGGQWVVAKSLDTFAPLGPFLATADEIADPQDLRISCTVTGELAQDSNTSQMVFTVAELVSYLSRAVTLMPGDVIATGTPPGVGQSKTPPRFLRPNDTVEVEVEGLGVLKNPVVAAEANA
jgi:2,4-didehydro-3-deoxy-L-rhamnonate hydrolase